MRPSSSKWPQCDGVVWFHCALTDYSSGNILKYSSCAISSVGHVAHSDQGRLQAR